MIAYLRDSGERVFVLLDHLDHFYAREQDRSLHRGLTGREIVAMARLRVVLGSWCAYNWRTGEVMLTRRVADGVDAYALMCAAHEVAHASQPKWLVALASIWLGAVVSESWVLKALLAPLWPIYLWCEVDAWKKAVGVE